MTIKYDDTTNPNYVYDDIQVGYDGVTSINPSTIVIAAPRLPGGIRWQHSKG